MHVTIARSSSARNAIKRKVMYTNPIPIMTVLNLQKQLIATFVTRIVFQILFSFNANIRSVSNVLSRKYNKRLNMVSGNNHTKKIRLKG